MKDNLRIPYGVAKFKTVRDEGLYYVDKTAYIRALEQSGRFLLFVRPRRFGKSIFIDMLRCYYDIAEKERFQSLFGDLDIGKDPTDGANGYQVLALDFSQVNRGAGKTLEERFNAYMGVMLDMFVLAYPGIYDEQFRKDVAASDAARPFTRSCFCSGALSWRSSSTSPRRRCDASL